MHRCKSEVHRDATCAQVCDVVTCTQTAHSHVELIGLPAMTFEIEMKDAYKMCTLQRPGTSHLLSQVCVSGQHLWGRPHSSIHQARRCQRLEIGTATVLTGQGRTNLFSLVWATSAFMKATHGGTGPWFSPV